MPGGSLLHLFVAVAAAPLLAGLMARTKALFAGRRGAPFFQLYRDLFRLFRKGIVIGETTTWIFRGGPLATLAGVLLAIAMTPFGSNPALLAFPGDVPTALAFLALGRFWTILAALDTGSSFEGLGASREAFFGALSEPALFIVFAVLVRITGSISMTPILAGLTPSVWNAETPALGLTAAALMILLLAENSRIPFDDPTTHLELTMIHEVMILDHSGPDLAAILYGASLKLWLFSVWLAAVVIPITGTPGIDAVLQTAGVAAVAVGIGIVESIMARLRLRRVPQLLWGAAALALVAFILAS